jgi:hypothetical protein
MSKGTRGIYLKFDYTTFAFQGLHLRLHVGGYKDSFIHHYISWEILFTIQLTSTASSSSTLFPSNRFTQLVEVLAFKGDYTVNNYHIKQLHVVWIL